MLLQVYLIKYVRCLFSEHKERELSGLIFSGPYFLVESNPCDEFFLKFVKENAISGEEGKTRR